MEKTKTKEHTMMLHTPRKRGVHAVTIRLELNESDNRLRVDVGAEKLSHFFKSWKKGDFYEALLKHLNRMGLSTADHDRILCLDAPTNVDDNHQWPGPSTLDYFADDDFIREWRALGLPIS